MTDSATNRRGLRAAGSFGVLAFLLVLSWVAHPHIKDVSVFFSLDNLIGYLVIILPLAGAMAIMHKLGRNWSHYGLDARVPVWKTLLLAVAGFVAVVAVMQFALIPVIYRIDATPPDISHLLGVRGNTMGYIVVMIGVWLTAAFGEEMLFRGFIMNEMASAFGNSRVAWAGSAIIIAVFFGLGHAYQGVSGMLITGSIGLLLNVLYLAVGRNLWVLILVHGFIDTFSITRLYLS
ncbi:MAG: type II CAAX endopeptidase family protein [Gammaproteobacteria bacterium]|jgi:hypothetical protein